MRRTGYALLEVIVVVAIVTTVSAMAVPLYRDYQIRSDLNLATEQATQGLARARFLSQSGQSEDTWGFYVPAGILYKGSSYAVRDQDYDETYPMPSTVTTTGLIEVSYEKLTGDPSATGAITLTTLNDEQRTVLITVEMEAVAVVENDNLTICHIPGSGTGSQHTITISESAWPVHRDNHGDSLGACIGASSASSAASSLVASSSSSSSAAGGGGTCEDRFTVDEDGTITTTGTVDVTFTVLGSDITYGEGGPEIDVFVSRKKLTGNGYSDLFDGDDVDGGEEEEVAYTNGKQVVVKVRGYFRQNGWLTFDQTYTSNDESGHIYVLRDGDELPDFPIFEDQGNLNSYLSDIIDVNDLIDIGTYDLVLLTELGLLQSSADFQDAVILLEFSEPDC